MNSQSLGNLLGPYQHLMGLGVGQGEETEEAVHT